MHKIETLTIEQQTLIPLYREKWQSVPILTEPIDWDKAVAAVKAVYKLIGEQEPEIIFCDSPYAALNIFSTKNLQGHLGRKIERRLRKPLQQQLENQINSQLMQQLSFELNPYYHLEGQIKGLIDTTLQFKKFISTGYWLGVGTLLDFGLSVLNCNCDRDKAETLQTILISCGWVLPYEKVCFVCERPVKLGFDSGKNYVHGEKEPAIQFVDGFSIP